jgi:hypothetical protein
MIIDRKRIPRIMTKLVHTTIRISEGINHDSMVVIVQFLIVAVDSIREIELIF